MRIQDIFHGIFQRIGSFVRAILHTLWGLVRRLGAHIYHTLLTAEQWTVKAVLKRVLIVGLVLWALSFALVAFALYYPSSQIPAHAPVNRTVYLNQGWGDSMTSEYRQTYYYTPQGTNLYNLRYSWFAALELPFSSQKFAGPNHMRALGFIVDDATTPQNPNHMPVGFTKHYDRALREDVLDITCAACHTGELHVATSTGERVIDSQYASSTKYVGKGPRGFDKLFGVNFADGRIKGYDLQMPGGAIEKTFFVQCVRGNPGYGTNDLHDNSDGTVTDRATGLVWSKGDSGQGLNWQAALAWVQKKNSENFLGHADWRLPSVKELQSIVDYTRSPDTTRSPAIDPVFNCTTITNEGGKADYPCYWSATTHAGFRGGAAAMYVAFGRAAGWMSPRAMAGGPPGPRGGFGPGPGGPPGAGPQGQGGGEYHFVDVHGAGAQRSDPKEGDPAMFPHGRGPQGDVIRIYNYVRLVRSEDVVSRPVKPRS